LARLSIVQCFKTGAIKIIPPKMADNIRLKIIEAIHQNKKDTDLQALYELIKRKYIDDNSWGEFNDEFDYLVTGFDYLCH
jgi:hypothetical protein